MTEDLDLGRIATLVATRVGDLPSSVLRAVAAELAALPAGSAPGVLKAVAAKVASPAAREQVAGLIDAWTGLGGQLPPAGLALALLTAAASCDRHRAEQGLELVWTGPAPPGNRLRRSDQVLLDLIQGARRELVVVTYAVYKSRIVWQALEAAVGRDVRLVIVPDVDERHEYDPAIRLRERLGKAIFTAAEIYLWPPDKRRIPGSQARGVLHAKCAVADRETLFLSSANLTDHALELNMELGLLVRGGGLPAGVVQHFERLVGCGELVRLS